MTFSVESPRELAHFGSLTPPVVEGIFKLTWGHAVREWMAKVHAALGMTGMFQLIKIIVKLQVAFVLAILLATALEALVVLPLVSALFHARLTAPPAGTWFEGNTLDFDSFEFLGRIADILPVMPPFVWVLSRVLIPNKDRRIRIGALSAVCLLLFGISVALRAILAPAHQYQASSEGITFPNASSPQGPLKWSEVTSLELACLYRPGGRYSPGYYVPSLVLHFGNTLALDLWEDARRANSLTQQKSHVEDFIHHFGEVFVRLPPTALANTVRHDQNCRQDFEKLLPSLTGSARQGTPPIGG